jgi:hypothetical protein
MLTLIGFVSDRKEVLTKPSVSDSSVGWEAGTGEGAREVQPARPAGPWVLMSAREGRPHPACRFVDGFGGGDIRC